MTSLDVDLPRGFALFDPSAISNGGAVYGTLYPDAFDQQFAAVRRSGTVQVLGPGVVSCANNSGLAGGYVYLDQVNFVPQAALFGSTGTELIPQRPGETSSQVLQVNDAGVALVSWTDEAYEGHVFLFDRGAVTPIEFPPLLGSVSFLSLNNRGTIAGTTYDGSRFRGFRFHPRSGTLEILSPVPTEPEAWGVGINNRGDVVGYSFVSNGRERIGVWDRSGTFKEYFVEGTPEVPTVSNALLINDNNTIVITATSDGTSYLVPRPGLRIDFADLIVGAPPDVPLQFVLGLNNRGDVIGYLAKDYNVFDEVLLTRGGGWPR